MYLSGFATNCESSDRSKRSEWGNFDACLWPVGEGEGAADDMGRLSQVQTFERLGVDSDDRLSRPLDEGSLDTAIAERHRAFASVRNYIRCPVESVGLCAFGHHVVKSRV